MSFRDGIEWFGREPWDPVFEPTNLRPMPVGRRCFWCDEMFEEGDTGALLERSGNN